MLADLYKGHEFEWAAALHVNCLHLCQVIEFGKKYLLILISFLGLQRHRFDDRWIERCVAGNMHI